MWPIHVFFRANRVYSQVSPWPDTKTLILWMDSLSPRYIKMVNGRRGLRHCIETKPDVHNLYKVVPCLLWQIQVDLKVPAKIAVWFLETGRFLPVCIRVSWFLFWSWMGKRCCTFKSKYKGHDTRFNHQWGKLSAFQNWVILSYDIQSVLKSFKFA